jgi:1-aminocyclopropane-1-carboxylate deaminase
VEAPLSLDAELLNKALAVPHQPIYLPQCHAAGVRVWLRRDDQLPGGNKYYKLYFNLKAAGAQGKQALVSFGGPHSNHLHALALACHRAGLHGRVLVRGYPSYADSPTITDVKNAGLSVEFVGHSEYRRLSQPGAYTGSPHEYVIPEGGANELGARGAEYIGHAVQQHFGGRARHLIMAAGTGSTLGGVARALRHSATQALGISVLKGAASASVWPAAADYGANWRMLWGFAGKGYGRALSPPMLSFWQAFEHNNSIAIDPIYTLKMLWGIERLAALGYWRRGEQLVAVHTGGLQGRRAFAQRPAQATVAQ